MVLKLLCTKLQGNFREECIPLLIMCQRILVEDNIRVDAVDYVPLCSGIFLNFNDENEYKIVQQSSWKGPFFMFEYGHGVVHMIILVQLF